MESGKGLQQIHQNNEHWKNFNPLLKKLAENSNAINSNLLNARAKSSNDSPIPIDNIMPPRAGAYNSLDTLKTVKTS